MFNQVPLVTRSDSCQSYRVMVKWLLRVVSTTLRQSADLALGFQWENEQFDWHQVVGPVKGGLGMRIVTL